MEYLDFEIEIDEGRDGAYRVAVLQSPVGQTKEVARFPSSLEELRSRLGASYEALVKARGGRDVVPAVELQVDSAKQVARELGRDLSAVLLAGQVGDLYVQSLAEAKKKPGRGLRLKLRTLTPELAGLPWELLVSPRETNFICLSNATPLVRFLPLPRPPETLEVRLPLRILGMVASPADLPRLDVEREKQRIEEAIAEPRSRGLVELVWLEEQTAQALHQRLQPGCGGPWHIFHFIGHGGFNSRINEGYLALTEKGGGTFELTADGLGDLVSDHGSLRLAVLNACQGARGGVSDLFSSTAAKLVRRGLPAVVSMQHEISDPAAIELAREFYRKLALGYPVDASLAEARKAISIALPRSVEWGTPVLHMRSPDGRLFDINDNPPPSPRPPRLEVIPQRVDFGTVREGQEASATIAVRNTGGGTLSWSFQTTGDFFTATRTADGLSLTLEARQGAHRGTVQITSTGGDVTVDVSAKVWARRTIHLAIAAIVLLSLGLTGGVIYWRSRPVIPVIGDTVSIAPGLMSTTVATPPSSPEQEKPAPKPAKVPPSSGDKVVPTPDTEAGSSGLQATVAQCTSGIIRHFPDGIAGLGASYNQDDQNRIVLVATPNGVVYELFYQAQPGGPPTQVSNPNGIWNDHDGSGIVAISGFYTDDDTFRHLVVATKDGKVHEYFYHPTQGSGESVIGSFPGIVDIAAFYNADDHYRVVLIATEDGKVQEVYFQPSPPAGRPARGESVIAEFGPGRIAHIAGTFVRETQDRRLVAVTKDGVVHQVLYNPMRGLHREELYHGGDADRIAVTGTSLMATTTSGKLLRITGPGQVGGRCNAGTNNSLTIRNLAMDYRDEGNLVYSTGDGSLHRIVAGLR